MAWIYLSTAVLANILSNVMFKKAMAGFPAEPHAIAVLKFLLNPYLWIGGVSCVVLLICYLLAIRGLGLAIAYAFVTSLSLIGISTAAAVLFEEALSWQNAAGVAMVILGLLLLAR